MVDAPLSRNPLTGTVVALLFGEAWTLWQWWAGRTQRDLIAVIVIIHAIVLAILYLRKSPAAGTFLFYSIVPIYPLYFALMYAGHYPRPSRSWVYAAMFAIWAVGIPFVWKEKRRYDRYIASIAAMYRDPA